MPDQWLCTVQGADVGSSARTELEYAIDDMANQLANDSSVSTTFSTYNPTYQLSTTPNQASDERDYVSKCLEELWDYGLTFDGDAWVIVDTYETYGYGVGNVDWTSPDGQYLKGGRALYTPDVWIMSDPVETFWNFGIQELAHCLGPWNHSTGGYEIDWANEAYDITPMATGYTYVNDDPFDRDTCSAGGATPPDDYDCGPTNGDGLGWCGVCSDPCRHDLSMTECTKDAIDNSTPL